jgi:hypothetical protein
MLAVKDQRHVDVEPGGYFLASPSVAWAGGEDCSQPCSSSGLTCRACKAALAVSGMTFPTATCTAFLADPAPPCHHSP